MEIQTIKLSIVTLVFALCASFLVTTSASATEPTCEAQGVTDDGGYIACGPATGPVRVTEVEYDGILTTVWLVLDESRPLETRLWNSPDRSWYAVALYEDGVLVAAGVVRRYTAEISLTDALDFTVVCTDNPYLSYCAQ